MIKKGTRVSIRPHFSKKGAGLTYPALTGNLLEPCNGEGWDVVEVSTSTGMVSVYSFSVQAVKDTARGMN